MKVSVALCVLLATSVCFAQTKDKLKNAVYGEVGGNGGDFSINYERVFPYKFVARVGVGKLLRASPIPLLGGKLFSVNKGHQFALMAGASYGNFRTGQETMNGFVYRYRTEWRGTAFLGYRYMQNGDRFLFHAGYTPFFYHETLEHSVGIGAGYRFKI